MEALWAVFAAGVAAALGIVAAGLAAWAINRQIETDRRVSEWASKHEVAVRAAIFARQNQDKDIEAVARKCELNSEQLELLKKESELPEGVWRMHTDPQTGRKGYVRAEEEEEKWVNQLRNGPDAANILDEMHEKAMKLVGR